MQERGNWLSVIVTTLLFVGLIGVFAWGQWEEKQRLDVWAGIQFDVSRLIENGEIPNADQESIRWYLEQQVALVESIVPSGRLEKDVECQASLAQLSSRPQRFLKQHLAVRVRNGRWIDVTLTVPNELAGAGEVVVDGVVNEYLRLHESNRKQRLDKEIEITKLLEVEYGKEWEHLFYDLAGRSEHLKELAAAGKNLRNQEFMTEFLTEQLEVIHDYCLKLHEEFLSLRRRRQQPSGVIVYSREK